MVPMRDRTNTKNYEARVRAGKKPKARDPTTLEEGTDFITDENEFQEKYAQQNSVINGDELIDEDEVVVVH